MKYTRLLFLSSLVVSLGACSSQAPSEHVPSESLEVSSSSTSFTYSEKLSLSSFEVKDKDGNKIDNDNLTIEGYDAYNNKEQKVKFIDNNSGDYGYYSLTLTPLSSFKVLLISNSHGEDVMRYSAELIQSAGITNYRFVNLYMAGAQIGTHLTNANSDFDGYQFQDYRGGEPVIERDKTIEYALKADDWDFIIMQQLSALSRTGNFVKDMDALIDYCYQNCSNKNVKFLYNMPFSYADMGGDTTLERFWDSSPLKMYENIAKVTKENVATDKKIEAIIPTGTTAQNAASKLGDNNIHRDSLHMNDLGRFIIAHAFVAKISGVSVSSLTYQGSFSDGNKSIAIKSATSAIENPYEVTAIS